MNKIVIGIGLLVAFSVSAFDFSSADTLFSHRENNVANIEQAKNLYEGALNSSQASQDERLYAMGRLGRLALYQSLLVPESDEKKQESIFERCLNQLKNVPPSAAYYYYKSVCLGSWLKYQGWFTQLRNLGEMKDLLQKGQAYPDYEGGGIFRVLAGVQVRSPSGAGLRDIEEARKNIEKAIQTGPQYYSAYMIKAEVLKAQNHREEGRSLLQDTYEAIRKMSNTNRLPEGLEAETVALLPQIDDMLRKF